MKVVENCKSAPFSILCDGGNDQYDKKYFADGQILGTFARQAVTWFLSFPVCNISTTESLFTALADDLDKHSIPWQNNIGYASDTASDKRNTIVSRLLLREPKLLI